MNGQLPVDGTIINPLRIGGLDPVIADGLPDESCR